MGGALLRCRAAGGLFQLRLAEEGRRVSTTNRARSVGLEKRSGSVWNVGFQEDNFLFGLRTFFSFWALCTKPGFIQHLFFRIFFSLHIYFNGGRIKLAFFFSSELRLFFDGRTEVNFNFAKWWRELKEERASLHFNHPTSTFLAPMPFLAKNLKSSSHSFTKKIRLNYCFWDSLRSQDPRSYV